METAKIELYPVIVLSLSSMITDMSVTYLDEYADDVLEIEMDSNDVVVPVLLNEMPAIEEEVEEIDIPDLPPSYDVVVAPPSYTPPVAPAPPVLMDYSPEPHPQFSIVITPPAPSPASSQPHFNNLYGSYGHNWSPISAVGQVH
ncbi:hypothetical protein MCUN1_001689 [Malassezia cuniculi]|uniref:Uncharacterized protein n=1 Tax=Malassezia cuniculi TaxID=948313 RepID=A0AAF0J692_9BASI|nr:hypothetical protein MCUN1_001689 [Malassezia cuniculi]